MDFFAPYMDDIQALCKQHGVRSLFAFGSAVKGEMGPESDVDLLLELPFEDPYEFTEHYWALEDALQVLLKRRVDLVSRRALRNKYVIAALDMSKVKLYEA